MIAGLVVFAAVAAFLAPSASAPPAQGGPPPPGVSPSVLLGVLAALLAACLVAFFAFGAAAQSQARAAWAERSDDQQGRQRLLGVLSTSTILRAALLEGPGLFAGVLVLLSGDLLPLIAVVIVVVLMATLLPMRSRLARLEEAATGLRPI
jgi:hypothetical protein